MRRPVSLDRKGFTLIELMIVVVIIGILAALAIPRFGQASARAMEKEAEGILKQYYTLQLAHQSKTGSYASTPEQLFEVGWEAPTNVTNYTFVAADFINATAFPKSLSPVGTDPKHRVVCISDQGAIAHGNACAGGGGGGGGGGGTPE